VTTAMRVLDTLSEIDPDAADELVRIATFEALADSVDAQREDIERDMIGEVVAKNDDVRRLLVRRFVDARISKSSVEPFLQAAAHLTMVDLEIAKARRDKDGRRQLQMAARREWWKEEPREHGRWTKHGAHNVSPFANQADSALDPVRALATKPGESGWEGSGQQWVQADRYERSRRIGQALSTSDNRAAQAGAAAAHMIGTLGPEAEDVLGPGLRRTAYRYRGTERRPDGQLLTEMAVTDKLTAGLTSPTPSTREAAKTSIAAISPSDIKAQTYDGERRSRPVAPPRAAIAQYNAAKGGLTRDQKLLDSRADVATNYLLKKIPTMANAELSMKAGKVPPSQGVLIDRDGNVVSQAVGFNGDHYIPFDLKNLKALHGGQYARTRVNGGPTTEDLYTGLLTGARQMTVASNAGVFNVEFDPDLRGGRRYNDKARQMVDRYSKLLGTIDSGAATVGTIDPERRKELKQQAKDEAGNNPEEANAAYQELLDREQKMQLFDQDDEDLSEKAHAMALSEAQASLKSGAKQGQYSQQAIARRSQEIEGDLKREAVDNRYRKLTLDGQGYHRALLALQEEFPYYVRRVSYTPLEQFSRDRGLVDPSTGQGPRLSLRGPDKGHVKPGNVTFNSDGRYKRKSTGGINDEAEGEKDTAKPGEKKAVVGTGSTVGLHPATKSWADAPLSPTYHREVDHEFSAFRSKAIQFIEPSEAGSKLPLADIAEDPATIVHYISKKRLDLDSFTKEFASLPDEKQEDIISSMRQVTGGLQHGTPDDVADAIEKDGDRLAEYLRIRKPFKKGDHMTEPDEAPIHHDDVAALGHVQSNYKKFEAKNTGTPLGKQIAEYATSGAKPQARIDDISTDIDTIKEAERENKPVDKAVVERLKHKQKAHAYLHAKDLATKYGIAGEDSGKAGASGSGASAGFVKRDSRSASSAQTSGSRLRLQPVQKQDDSWDRLSRALALLAE
jgi:hypothetical protein